MPRTRLATHRGERNTQLLEALIQAKGLAAGDYAHFFHTGEGRALPISKPGDDVEEQSGYVLDRQGRVFYYWFGWDRRKKAAALTTWQQVQPQEHWLRSAEYRRALEKMGLPVAEPTPSS